MSPTNVPARRACHVRDFSRIDYDEMFAIQQALWQKKVDYKIAHAGALTPDDDLLFCEHAPIYTLGRNADDRHLLADKNTLTERGIQVRASTRGGDITFHGPGQIVMYPIVDLEAYRADIAWYVGVLEQSVMATLAEYGIVAGASKGERGVWLDADNPTRARKICAIGVRCGRWITMHGLALNVNTDLTYFDHIIPCGIRDKQVTSMQKELSQAVNMEVVKKKLQGYFLDFLRAAWAR